MMDDVNIYYHSLTLHFRFYVQLAPESLPVRPAFALPKNYTAMAGTTAEI